MRLEGKIAVVTGADSETGSSVCGLFEREGAAVERMPYVDGAESCREMISAALHKHGRIDIVVNCSEPAGALRGLLDTSDELYERTVSVNQFGPFYMCREALKYFAERMEGVIVNVASEAGIGAGDGTAYAMAEHGLVGLSRNIALQYADQGIRCNVVCHGPLKGAQPEAEPEFSSLVEEHVNKWVRPVSAEDTAYAALFFACGESRNITGQFLQVDGGRFFKGI